MKILMQNIGLTNKEYYVMLWYVVLCYVRYYVRYIRYYVMLVIMLCYVMVFCSGQLHWYKRTCDS